MSERTPNLQLPYILSNQAQKHVTHNEAIRNLDALVQISIEDKDLSSPPATPTDGDCYIVATGATGDWAGNENLIASWQDEAWSFYAPEEGWTAWIKDEDFQMVYDGVQWQSLSSGGGGGSTNLNPATGGLVGVNATADTTNRLSVNSPASLFNHDGDDHQLKISKNSVADNASVIFQTAFSGRAEFGLTGDDDFHMKVSPDGSTFHEGIVIDKDTGEVSFPNTTFSGGAVNSVFGRTGTITAESGDYSFDQIVGVSQNVLLGRVSAGTGAQEALTSAQVRALLNVEDGATADQTGAEIKTAYEAQSDTNAFTDAEQAKLAAIEAAASADQTDTEIETAYNNQVAQVSSGEITAGTQTAIRRYAPADIKSFIDTHASGGGGSVTDEEVEDIVGAMVSGNNEQRITTTYDDVAGKLDFVVDNNLANYDNSSASFLTSVSGTDIVLGSDAQGDLIYHNGTAYTRLPAGTSGQFLKTQGAGANPVWETISGGGGGGGKILQVISTHSTTHQSTSSTSYVDCTGLSASITPSSTSSKILVMVTFSGYHANSHTGFVRLLRDATEIGSGTGPGSGVGALFSLRTNATHITNVQSFNYLDSPATISPITYKLQMRTTGSGSPTYMNRSAGTGIYDSGTPSQITLMEVSA